MSSLEQLYLQAWIDGLKARNDAPAVRTVDSPARYVPLTDTGRARYVRLRPAEPPR